jgi:hypothetical protein
VLEVYVPIAIDGRIVGAYVGAPPVLLPVEVPITYADSSTGRHRSSWHPT